MSKFVKGDDNQDDEEWQAAHAHDPVQRFEPVDNRSLFEKLQEQKAAKEDALLEATKFSNLIRRLDNDEIDFLAGVNEQKAKDNAARKREQERAIERFRTAQREVDSLQKLLALEKDSAISRKRGVTDIAADRKVESKRRQLKVTGIVKRAKREPARQENVSENSKETVSAPDIASTPSEISADRSGLIAYGSDSDDG